MVTHYQFLQSLHELLQPRSYLEIGVQTGASLALASCPAYGVDPAGMSRPKRDNERVYAMTSDDFFRGDDTVFSDPVDLIYIDGMHLFEYALRDFMGALRYANERTVIVFDDVIPYSPEIAGREPIEGDWTGDVWKLIPCLEDQVDGCIALVDVWPTGALVVWDWDPDVLDYLTKNYEQIVEEYVHQEYPAWLQNPTYRDAPDDTLRDLGKR